MARARSGWRTLAAFWVLLVVCAAVGAGILQALGPPRRLASLSVAPLRPGAPAAPPGARPAHEPAGHEGPADPANPPPSSVQHEPAPPNAEPTRAEATRAGPPPAEPALDGPRAPGAAIIPPQDALLEPAPDFPGSRLPRTGGHDGAPILPMKVYAGGFDPRDRSPRVALLLAGMGLSAADSEEAIKRTPAGVSLAFSPYALAPDLTQARARGHEYLISIPMEPAGYPLNDEGPHALLTGASLADNVHQLEWTLSRIQGYAGATGALGGLRGERFAGAQQMTQITADLRARGLYYIDPRVGPPASSAGIGGSIDMVIDEPSQAADIDAKLARLERLAVDHGAALGLAGAPRPVTVERIAAWAGRLPSHGIALVPVSAILTTPAPPVRAGAAR